MKIKVVIFSILFILSGLLSVHAEQPFIRECLPDKIVPVKLYGGLASCGAVPVYPSGYNGPRNTKPVILQKSTPTSTLTTIEISDIVGNVEWDEPAPMITVNIPIDAKDLGDANINWRDLNNKAHRTSPVFAKCTASVPFVRLDNTVVKGECHNTFNPNQCGCLWEQAPFAGGLEYEIHHAESAACPYDKLLLVKGAVTCFAKPVIPTPITVIPTPPPVDPVPLAPTPQPVTPTEPTPSVATPTPTPTTPTEPTPPNVGVIADPIPPSIPSNFDCVWESKSFTGHPTGPMGQHEEEFRPVGECLNKIKIVYYDAKGNEINTIFL